MNERFQGDQRQLQGYKPVLMTADAHLRLHTLKRLLSDLLWCTPERIGACTMVQLLIDHWENAPPEREWIEARARLYPKRGRRRKKNPIGQFSGHSVAQAAANPDLRLCIKCGYRWLLSSDGNMPMQCCPVEFPDRAFFEPKKVTEEELKELLFNDDEIASLLP